MAHTNHMENWAILYIHIFLLLCHICSPFLPTFNRESQAKCWKFHRSSPTFVPFSTNGDLNKRYGRCDHVRKESIKNEKVDVEVRHIFEDCRP